jgi:hypothetical protein
MSDAQTSEERGKKNTAGDYRVIEEDVFWLKGRSVALSKTAPPPKPAPVRRPAHVARQLALAHHLQRAIDRGIFVDQAALARKLGLTRARVSQLFDLLMLAADLQEQVLALEAVDGAEPMAERTLRAVAHAGTWAEQRAAWGKLGTGSLEQPRRHQQRPILASFGPGAARLGHVRHSLQSHRL